MGLQIGNNQDCQLGDGMVNLSKDEIQALGHAVVLEIEEPELTEVMYSLNALLESLDSINPPGLEDVEPLPIILPPPPGS